jgi:hypothetical protein
VGQLSGSPQTNQPTFIVSYITVNTSTQVAVPGVSYGSFNGVTPVTIVAAPASGYSIGIGTIFIDNTDTLPVVAAVSVAGASLTVPVHVSIGAGQFTSLPQGPPGQQGATGATGSNGSTVLHGTSDPTTIGNNGDFYINMVSHTLFGPKATGSWPSGVSLVGPQGAAGSNGTNGSIAYNAGAEVSGTVSCSWGCAYSFNAAGTADIPSPAGNIGKTLLVNKLAAGTIVCQAPSGVKINDSTPAGTMTNNTAGQVFACVMLYAESTTQITAIFGVGDWTTA